MKARIAQALGWSIEDVNSFSLSTLRELVRISHPGLADQITQEISSGRVLVMAHACDCTCPTPCQVREADLRKGLADPSMQAQLERGNF